MHRPISSPWMLSSGPPLLPLLMAASVWIRSVWEATGVRMRRSMPETIPWLTECQLPRGFPMITTGSPSMRSEEEPRTTSGNLRSPLILISARSSS